MDDKPKVDVNVDVCTWSNIEQWKVLIVTRHSQGDTELAGSESVMSS